MSSVIVLASGGVASAVVASMLSRDSEVNLLFSDYGQVSADRQWKAVQALGETVQAAHTLRFDMSCLVTPASQVARDKEISSMPEVLAQSGMFCSQLATIGAWWATRLHCNVIHFGFSQVADEEDQRMGLSSGQNDHRREFLYTINTMLEVLCPENPVKAEALLLDRSREETVRLAERTHVSLDQLWYCEKNSSHPCGGCRECRRWGAYLSKPEKTFPRRK